MEGDAQAPERLVLVFSVLSRNPVQTDRTFIRVLHPWHTETTWFLFELPAKKTGALLPLIYKVHRPK